MCSSEKPTKFGIPSLESCAQKPRLCQMAEKVKRQKGYS